MNMKGRQNENNEAVRALVDNAVEVMDDLWELVDDAGNMIKVDTGNGISYRVVDGVDVECNTGDKSEKQNGYVYTELMLEIAGKLKKVNYGTHSLVAMLAHKEEYDELVDMGENPVANHKNNCHWDNADTNLEWTTQRYNVLHGKAVHSLHQAKDWLNRYCGVDCTTVTSNKSNNEYVVLIKGLSCKDIAAYEEYVTNTPSSIYGRVIAPPKSLKQYWGITKNTDTVRATLMYEFISWLQNNGTSITTPYK